MFSEPVLIEQVSEDQQILTVRGQRQSTCGACTARLTCGHGMLAMRGAPQNFALPMPRLAPSGIKPGDTLQLRMPGNSLLVLAFRAYIQPLVAALVCSTLAANYAPSQTTLQVAATLGGLLAGVWWSAMRPAMKREVKRLLRQSEYVLAKLDVADS